MISNKSAYKSSYIQATNTLMLFVNRVKKMLLKRKWYICSLPTTSLYLVNILRYIPSSKWRLLNNHCCAFFKPLGVKTPIRFVRDKKWRVTTSTYYYLLQIVVRHGLSRKKAGKPIFHRSIPIHLYMAVEELEQILNNIDFDNCLGIYISTYLVLPSVGSNASVNHVGR